MSIPLDRLYHYIESVAQDVYGDTVIYHFYPHGSKKIEDLVWNLHKSIEIYYTLPQIFCYDQEPLNFKLYQNLGSDHFKYSDPTLNECLIKSDINLNSYNIRNAGGGPYNIYDQCVLLHSELNSENLRIYEQSGFVGAYYWSHAFIAQDWFRYARWLKYPTTDSDKLFLIYNRAWDGTREYRIKFLELLVQNDLVNCSKTNFNPVNSNNEYYQNYQFNNNQWRPSLKLEEFFQPTQAPSSSSADFNETDYFSTDIEVVLETLFDDNRIHLTEKTLRPIALSQPFILCSTPGSLQYLRNYGFQTFHSVFSEEYDNIVDPSERLNEIAKLMQSIANWGAIEKSNKIKKLQEIARFNRQYFFSDKFTKLISNELTENLKTALNKVVTTNTSTQWLKLVNAMLKNKQFQDHIINPGASNILNQYAIDYMYNKASKFQNKY